MNPAATSSANPPNPPGVSPPRSPAEPPPGRAPVLRAAGLERSLGEGEARVPVLRGVSFAVRPGERCAIVGPSGCGKSTLLYLLGLLDRQDAGEIWLGDQPLAHADDERRTAVRGAELGFVFQFHFLLPEFTALENVLLPMRQHGRLKPAAMEARGRELLDAVGLADKARRRATALSGGEQQRVALARALANRPRVILADEPTGNLDARNSDLVFDLLSRLAREHDLAVVLVTHNADLARRCDIVRTMRDGRFVD